MHATIPHWINGRPYLDAAAPKLPVEDPATGEQVAEVTLADDATVKIAVDAALGAAAGWAALPAARRAQALYAFRELVRDHIDELAAMITTQHGKTLDDARGEVTRGLDAVELACGVPGLMKGEMSEQTGRNIDTYSTLHPLGVVVGITPFNFPVMIPLMMASVAIAAGNAFVLKPSEQDPGPALRIAELAQEAGIPDGIFTIVNGQRECVEALVDHPDVAAVSFVGSTPIAHSIYRRAAEAGKRAQAFGGAKNHLVVMPDAPIESAADAISSAAFGAAGQRCMAISVAVAVGDIADDLVAALKQRTEGIRVGPGTDPATEVGPVVSRVARDRIRHLVSGAVDAGAVPVVDRSRIEVGGHPGGHFVGPVLLDQVAPDSELYRTEVFGPVLAVVRVDTLDEALELIRTHEYGNGASIFTRSGNAAHRFQREASAGMVGINVPIPVPVSTYAVAGWKRSRFGDTGLTNASWTFYTQPKYVTSRWDDTVAGMDFGFRPN
ncbi:CoA-acylating methylmalonate-semialdehyde dehydrogenase [Nocardioides sp. YIM B13467]|uniref:CoA-acylating methylmalonate-semialdehyde dehydrogenase n=1 Tax=Nocardioides sp. YIM B13467 TaxID=3366294 RepID=UPI0036726D67